MCLKSSSLWSLSITSLFPSSGLSTFYVQRYLSLADRTAVLVASLYGLVVPGSTSLSLIHPPWHATGAQPVSLVPTDSLPLSSKPSRSPLSAFTYTFEMHYMLRRALLVVKGIFGLFRVAVCIMCSLSSVFNVLTRTPAGWCPHLYILVMTWNCHKRAPLTISTVLAWFFGV